MKKERKVWAMTLIVLWWLAPNLLEAQQDSTRSTGLEEVVITATKYPKSIGETGKVLTVIDEAQLSRSAGKDVAQLLNEQVGLIVNGANSNPGKDKSVFLRGAGSGYTLILLDGIPLNDPSGVGGVFDPRLLPIDQIERIEILKGSQSTLYGTDAIGGVINLITKKKGSKPFGVSALLSGGSYNTLKGNLSVSGNTDRISYSLGYTRFATDGISEARDSTGTAGFDKDGFDQDAFQGSIGFNIGKSLVLRPYVRYNDFDGKYDDNGFTDSKVDAYKSNLLNAGISAQYELSKGSLNFLYGYDKTDRTFDSDFGVSKFYGRFQHAEAFWRTDLSKLFQLLAGMSYQDQLMLDESAAVKDPAATITSPYASFFLRDLGGLSVELGGRLNAHSKYGNNFTYSLNPSYWIKKQFKLFFNASSGFKVPTLNQLYGQFGPNPDLKPEKSNSLEAGLQIFSGNKKFDVRVSAFQRTLSDVIYFSFDPVTFESAYVNLNEQNDQGFEVEATARITPAFTFRGFYGFVDGYLTDKSSGTEVKDYNLIRRPKNSYGLNFGYQISEDLYAGLNMKSFGTRSDLYFNSSTFDTENVTLEPYTLLDLYLEYKMFGSKMKVFIDAKNLLNQDYMEVYGYNTLKFNIMSGLSLSF